MPKSEDQQKLRTAISFHQAGRLDKAAALYREIISIDQKNYYALHYLGMIEATAGRHEEAKALLHRSLALEPPNIQFLENYATILFQLGDCDSALEISQRGLRLNHTSVTLLYVAAISLFKLRQLRESVAQFDKLLLLVPNHITAINERGSALAEMKEYDAALASFEKALTFQPQYAEAYFNKCNVLGALRRYDEALAACDRALALKPALADAWASRGNVLIELERYEDASLAYDKALALKPDLAGAWLGRGNLLARLKRNEEALIAYDKALSFEPDLPQAWRGRGNILAEFWRSDDALAAYDKAVALKPDLEYAPGARFFAKLDLCDWTNLQRETAYLLSMIREQKPASTPFYLLAAKSSAADQLQCAKRYVQDQPNFPQVWRGETYSHDRIRVAYLSADFRDHAVSYLTAGLFEHHDKSRFEITAISVGPNHESPMRHRLEAAFERFIDAPYQSDQEIADLIRRLEIDIAVDLMGFTTNSRLGVFARRPAPIQVNYLGYSGTMGAGFIDYILADPTVIPEDQCVFYAEQVIWLPDSYLVNDDRRPISPRTRTRHECGLPDNGFVYCCFNNSYKIAPETFHVWMRLLKATADSVLWLSDANPTARANLRREAERCGVSAKRLIFAPKMPEIADHLARLRQADLFVDTLPYNAHMTACDALWAGVPIVTYLGATFVGRVAASLLKAVGLDELITRSLEEYEALALKLAHDPSSLGSIRDRLARNRNTFPLFNTEHSTRQIEAAYTMMWERHQRGETQSGVSKPIRIA
jgi:predicted O-linked N-acetylglucosamine transferase (SPINDLY family)